jgi:hypothetical protein
MDIGTFLLVSAPIIAVLAGCMAVVVKRMFSRFGDWLPVLAVTYIPPVLIQIVLFPIMLSNHVPDHSPDAADGPSVFVAYGILSAGSALTWLVVACPAAFVALGLYQRNK